jgi:hypothetical protein
MRARALAATGLVLLAVLGWLLWRQAAVSPEARPTAASAASESAPTDSTPAHANAVVQADQRAGVTEPGTAATSPDSASLPKAMIRGRVVNPANAPIPDASVLVGYRPGEDFNILDLAYSQQDIAVGSVQTGADGAFAIEVPPEWPLRVRAHAAGYSDAFYNDVFAGADLLFVLERGTALIGQVTRKKDGSPVEGTVVRLFRYGGPALGEVRTGADGRYAIRDVPPGASVIAVESTWLADPPWTDVDLPQGAQVIRDFALEEGVSIFGTVTDATTGAPITDAEIGAGWTYDRPVRSGIDGTYELRGFGGPGVYEVYVRADGYVEAKKDYGPEAMPTERTRLDFPLAPGYSITGRVLDPSGTPIAQVYVAAVSDGGPDGIESWKSGRSVDDGTFEIRSLSPQHQYGLFVRASGWGNAAYLLEPFSGTSPMNVGDLHLQPAGSISGVVADEAGRVRNDVTVGLRGKNADAGRLTAMEHPVIPRNLSERSVHTDPAGRFHFGEVAEGEYTLRAQHRSGHDSDPQSAHVGPGERLAEIRLVLPSGLRLHGRALTPDGEGIPGARIRVVPTGIQGKDRYTTTGDGGSFEFLGLDQGAYTLVVQDFISDEDSDRFTAVLDNIMPSEDELKVVVPRAALLRGTVLAPDGQPSPRAYVSALLGTIYLNAGFCDEKGAFELAVPDGSLFDVQAFTTSPSTDPRYPFQVNHEGLRATASAVGAGQDIVLRLQAP